VNPTTVDRREIERWRREANRRWAGAVPGDAPDGWSACPVDPAVVLPAFARLELRSGYHLGAYLYRSAGNSNTSVYALPLDARLPPPAARDEPPPPAGALGDVMDAITGDGSAESYLQASVLARELEEFGAAGHGMRWTVTHVLDADVWDEPGELSPSRPRPTLPPEQYRWSARIPEDFRPTVVDHNGQVVVRFFTYCALGQEEIVEHVDVYDRGDYAARPTDEVLATGDRGFRL
jgi:hypothetical protein